METLDDSIKDNETNKDVTDKAALPDEGLETVKVSAFYTQTHSNALQSFKRFSKQYFFTNLLSFS